MDFSLYNFVDNWIIIACVLGAVVVILLILYFVIKNTTGSSSDLILKEFNFDKNENDYLEIIGRAPGFINWVKSLFDKAPITIFTCSKRELKYNNYYIPMKKISCVFSEMKNKFRIILFILGIIFIITEIALSPSEAAIRTTLIVVGIIFILCSFIKNRTVYFKIFLYENKPFITLTLKKGIINSIEDETFEAVANTLNETVFKNAHKVVMANSI